MHGGAGGHGGGGHHGGGHHGGHHGHLGHHGHHHQDSNGFLAAPFTGSGNHPRGRAGFGYVLGVAVIVVVAIMLVSSH